MPQSSSSSAPNNNWFVKFHGGHERVKNAVHSFWRQNSILSPRGKAGKFVMSCFYFSIPVVAGYFVVTKVVDGSESTVRERLAETDSPTSLSSSSSSSSLTQKVGAGGWGGGVHLASSDRGTQDVNRINLERFMKKQRKLKERREREAAAAVAAKE